MTATDHEEEVLGKAYDARLVRRLLGHVRPYRKLAAFAVVVLVAYSAVDLLAPWLIRQAVDGPARLGLTGEIPPEEAYSRLLVLALEFAGLIVLAFAFRAGHMWLTEYLGQRVMVDVRKDLFGKIQHLSLRFFDRNPVGRLVTRVVSDVEALYEALSSGLVALFGDLVKIVAIGVILFVMNPGLALWLLSVIPVLFLVSILFRRWAREGYRNVRREVARTSANLQESITGVRVIQAYGQEDRARRRFFGLSDRLLDAHVGTVRQFAWYIPAVELLFAVEQALLIWVGARYVAHADLSAGDFILVWFYIQLIFEPIRDLSQQYNVMQGAMAASERIFGILDTDDDVPNPPAPVPLPPGGIEGRIEFENVWFAYRGEDWVLRDVSFVIEPGQSVALVGATGAGKTSIISLVSRLYDIQRGRILLDGRDLREYDKYELRERISVVLQDPFLFAGNVLENIRLGHPEISRERVIEAAKAVNADPFVRRLAGGYDAPVLERGATFSTGQKQLLAFARALAFDPRVLILDEATSSIDTETEILIQKALEKLLEGRTSIIIAHRLSTIQRCDRILVLHHGELKEEDTHQELLHRRGIYRRLYDLQYGLTAG